MAWKGDGSERKGRFFVNLHVQRQHWERVSIKMETLPSFALELEKDDFLFSFDIHAGYRHFYLHPQMRLLVPLWWAILPMYFPTVRVAACLRGSQILCGGSFVTCAPGTHTESSPTTTTSW